MSRFVPVLGREGDIWQGPGDLIDELEEFTCALYGNLRTTSVNELSCVTWYYHICVIQLLLPVSTLDASKALTLKVWKLSHIAEPDIPSPFRHGWTNQDGTL